MNRNSRISRWGLSAAGTALFLVVWYLVTDVFNLFIELILPSPVTIVQKLLEFPDLIFENFIATFQVAVFGFLTAVVLGILGATAFTMSDRLSNALMPLVVSGNSVPRVSLAPLIIFYLGGFDAKYLISAWVAFFPMFLNAFEGLETISDEQSDLLATFEATSFQEYIYVRFPNALPHIFDGMKIAVTLAIVGAVVGEFVASDSGLGYLALFALREFQTALVFGVTGIMGLISVIAFFTLFLLQDRLVYWKETKLFGE